MPHRVAGLVACNARSPRYGRRKVTFGDEVDFFYGGELSEFTNILLIRWQVMRYS